jgi:hypothetical protein
MSAASNSVSGSSAGCDRIISSSGATSAFRSLIASAQAAEGIRAEAGRDFTLAQGEAEFAHAVVAQLQTLSSAAPARDCILAHYDWARNLGTIDPLFEAASAAAPVLETCPA